MNDEKRWITWRGRRILVNNNGNIEKKKEKKIDYQKYLETRKNSIAGFIAINGIVENLSEKKANELYKMGIPENLLPYVYPFKDDSEIKNLNNVIEMAKETKEMDKDYQEEVKQRNKEKEELGIAEETLERLNKKYKEEKTKFKDYETDDVNYQIDQNTFETITNDWAFKDKTRDYFDTLDTETKKAIGDYTSQIGEYNFAYFNNILNEKWEGRQLDNEAKKRMQLIDNAINNSTIDEDMYLYRSFNKMRIDKDGYITNKGYVSTSLYKSPTESYFDKVDILKIRVPKGTKGIYIGANTMSMVQEYEVLLPRNTKIKVLGVNKDGTIESEIVR